MKIHYIVTSLEGGGAEFAIPQIVQAFQHYGHSVQITAVEPRDMGAASRLEAAHIPYRILFPQRINFVKTVIAFIKLLKTSKPDVIWTSLSRATLIGQIAGLVLGIPVVSWKNSANLRFTTSVGKSVTKLWIADSLSVAQFLHTRMHVPQQKIMSWPLYVCDTPQHVKSHWDGQSVLHIGSTGRLHEVKNYPLLIEGIALFCARNPDKAHLIHLSLAGDGPQRAELETLIVEKGLKERVTLLGFITNVQDFLQNLHVYTQPSRYEGMCLAAHEAMAMGLPILATPVGEMANSVQEHVTGLVLSKDNTLPESVCRSLEHIFAHPSSLKQMGLNARQYVHDNFSIQKYRLRCKEILDKIERGFKTEKQ